MTPYDQTREALEAINCIDTRRLKCLLCELVESDIFDGGLINKTISAVEKARRALALPRRNCDVGTPEEQGERCLVQFNEWRRKGDGKKLITAIMEWAQMPYTQEKKGKTK